MDHRMSASARAMPRGLVIEGTAATPAGRRRSAPAGPTNLAARAAERPAQSLLDDALRLARECRFLQGRLRSLPFS